MFIIYDCLLTKPSIRNDRYVFVSTHRGCSNTDYPPLCKLQGWFSAYDYNYLIILLFLSLAKVYGIRVRTFGHKFNFSDRCLIILNHRCHFDWLFFWLVVAMRGDSTKWMVMLKRVAKFAPFFGKSMI